MNAHAETRIDKESNERAGTWEYLFAGIVIFILLLLIYGLSSGPAAWLLCHSESGTMLWNRAYWPVTHCLDGTPMVDAFSSYLHWWVNLSNPGPP